MPAPTIDPSRLGEDYTAELRALLDTARGEARERHRQVSGIEAAVMYSESLRNLLVHHATEVARRLDCEDIAKTVCLVAAGGFGRYEMGIWSDLDFLFLTAEEPTEREEAFIKAILHSLWNLKLELGYGVFSIRGCLATLGTDLHRTTSLVETRYIWGEPGLGEELADRVHSRLRKKYLHWFIEALDEETRQRHKQQGDTVFLLEPDVKEARGGLRDIHLILWTTFALFGSGDLETLAENSYISEEERQRLLEAWSFHLDLRNSLHLSEGRRVDKLTLERQISVARSMGFERTDLALAEERLMRSYYDRATLIEKLSKRLMETTLRRTPGTRLNARRNQQPQLVDRDFWLRGEHLWLEERDMDSLRLDPNWPIRLFLAAVRSGAQPSDNAQRVVEEYLVQGGEALPRSSVVRDDFLRILQTPGCIADTLRTMNRCGYLSAYFPEWASVRNLPRIDHYHQYTVDEHLIRSVGVAESLQSDNPPAGMEHVASVAKEILRLDLLHLSLLFHDIGKGEGRGHVILGMHTIMRIAERLGLRTVERETLRLLVANHQKMNHLVVRRDIEDVSLARELAEAARSPELLRMLYVHSACDLAAVSMSSWNDWRGRLLAVLFERTLDVMRGVERKSPLPAPQHELRERIWQEIQKADAPEGTTRGRLEDFVSNMPDRYLLSALPRDVAMHFLLSLQISGKRRVVHRIDQYEGNDYVEITFVARDAPGLFSSLCRAMASKGFNILSAQIYTAFSGEAVDIFQVQVPPAFQPTLEEILERICSQIQRMWDTGQVPKWTTSVGGGKMVPLTRERLDMRPPRVEIKNELSATHTVVEVGSPDRPGLLSRIAETFDTVGINVDRAFIATEGYHVVDVFYVTDLETNKIVEPNRLKALREGLLKVICEGLDMPECCPDPEAQGADNSTR